MHNYCSDAVLIWLIKLSHTTLVAWKNGRPDIKMTVIYCTKDNSVAHMYMNKYKIKTMSYVLQLFYQNSLKHKRIIIGIAYQSFEHYSVQYFMGFRYFH